MKEQSKFTSGKWVACTDATVGIEGADGLIDDFICECDSGMYCDRPFDEVMGNTRLIAAVPEMYRILREIQDWCEDNDLTSDIECDIWEVLCSVEGKEAKI